MRRAALLAAASLALVAPAAEAKPRAKLTFGEARQAGMKALDRIDAYDVSITRKGAVRWSRRRLVIDARYEVGDEVGGAWIAWTVDDELTVTERHGRIRVSSIWFDL